MAIAGCGPGRPTTIPVEGVVTLDGKPVAEATILFLPVAGGRPAEGITDARGHFTLRTFVDGDGALPGKHQVTVQKVRLLEGKGSEFTETPVEWLLPQKYSQTATSGLTVEVTPDGKLVELALHSK